jgi:hypothetical protein
VHTLSTAVRWAHYNGSAIPSPREYPIPSFMNVDELLGINHLEAMWCIFYFRLKFQFDFMD